MNNAHMRTLWKQLNILSAIGSVHPLDVDKTTNCWQVDCRSISSNATIIKSSIIQGDSDLRSLYLA